MALLTPAGCFFPDYTFDESATTSSNSSSSSDTGGNGVGAGGAGGAGGVSAGGSGGEGGSGGAPLVEDCFAPGDEDGNGTADCADPACDVDLECVDPIPVGWGGLGLVALFDGGVAVERLCPDGGDPVYSGRFGLNQGAPTCTPCTCGQPSWSDCRFNIDLDEGQDGRQPLRVQDVPCGQMPTNSAELTIPEAWELGCTATDVELGSGACPGMDCNLSIVVGTAGPGSGTCTPSGGVPIAVEPTWSRAVEACATTEGLKGCGTGELCAPRQPAPFEGRVCISKGGDQTCPAAGYTEKHVAFGEVFDGRSCSACTCEAAVGGSCTLSVNLYDPADGLCSAPVATVEADPVLGCVELPASVSVGHLAGSVSAAPSGGACTPGQAVGDGAFEPAEPTTFCCLPP
jgi:hypothetical protein